MAHGREDRCVLQHQRGDEEDQERPDIQGQALSAYDVPAELDLGRRLDAARVDDDREQRHRADEVQGYGVDHVAVAEGLGCKAIRVRSPNEFKEAFAQARSLMEEHQVPVVLEFILERVTNVSMGTELQDVNEFEDILCLDPSLTLEDVSGSVLSDGDDKAPTKEPEPA
jgi:hypothetical protein